ncbi:cation:proton antiporter [Alloscardovia venturai]|uniref:Cation:proton antiporter n=1 Tax=Alloscardovia venturai TaxID=1769421 RepID=A0ABW2Y877_9BIFI
MGSLLLILEIGVAVIISSLLSPYIPRVSMPLVQIVLGVVWFFTPGLPLLNIDSDLFLILFIAPLLFFEALHLSRSGMKRTLYLSISLAVGLVLLSVFITGVSVHLLFSAIPLAAGFLLGAALGPTDAVSVAQLGNEAKLTQRQMNVLSTESLFNDAASIVSFQFALTALLTGYFSPRQFTLNVLYSFIGAALIGALMGFILNKLIMWLRRARLETTTNRILIELVFPFAVYWLGEELHVSGVIAVVMAGIMAVYHRIGVGEDLAEVNRVSSAVWDVFTFVLNGSVFVLLGIELPLAMKSSIINPRINIWVAIGLAVLLTLMLLLVRFLWISAMLRVAKAEDTGLRRKMTPERWHSAAVMTFGGAKGTISLVLAFSIPSQVDTMTNYPVRTALLFIAAFYTLISLLLANIVVPILSPKQGDKDGHKFALANLEMLNRTLVAISRMDNPQQHFAVEAVMRSYNSRIARQRGNVMSPEEMAALHDARLEIRQWQSLWLQNYMRNHLDCTDACQRLLAPIEYSLTFNESNWRNRLRTRLYFIRLKMTIWVRSVRATIRFMWNRTVEATTGSEDIDYRRSLVTSIQIHMLQDAIHHEFTLINYRQVPPVIGSTIIGELRTFLRGLQAPHMANPYISSPEQVPVQFNDVLAQAYSIELETIRKMAEANEITHDQARRMRHNVFIMQSDSVQ